MVKFTIRKSLYGSVYVGLYYKMVDEPVKNRVSSTVYFKWWCKPNTMK